MTTHLPSRESDRLLELNDTYRHLYDQDAYLYLSRLGDGQNRYVFRDRVCHSLREAEEHMTSLLPRHADYPHRPGTLYDCPACEAICFCDDSTCVHCAVCGDER